MKVKISELINADVLDNRIETVTFYGMVSCVDINCRDIDIYCEDCYYSGYYTYRDLSKVLIKGEEYNE